MKALGGGRAGGEGGEGVQEGLGQGSPVQRTLSVVRWEGGMPYRAPWRTCYEAARA